MCWSFSVCGAWCGSNANWTWKTYPPLQCYYYLHCCFQGWNKKLYGKSQIQNLMSIEFHLKFARIYVHDTKMHGSTLYFVNLLLRHGTALQEITLASRRNHAVTRSQRRKIHYEMTKLAKTSCKVLISSQESARPIKNLSLLSSNIHDVSLNGPWLASIELHSLV